MATALIGGNHALIIQIKGQAAALFQQSAVYLYPFWAAG
jgi:hypothetical protein